MVCLYCGGTTQVINSRHQKRQNQVWRRRECLSCHSVFSTHESASYEDTWRVKGPEGALEPFQRNQLLISLHHSLEHRKNSVAAATGLLATILGLLQSQANHGLLEPDSIAITVYEVLSNFDKAAAVHYAAFHPSVTN